MHWTIARDVEELAGEAGVAWNRMAVTLIELGIDVFSQLRLRAPKVAAQVVKIRRAPLEGRQRRTVDRIVEGSANIRRLDERFGFALPSEEKEKIRSEAKRRGIKMSQVGRERIGVKR